MECLNFNNNSNNTLFESIVIHVYIACVPFSSSCQHLTFSHSKSAANDIEKNNVGKYLVYISINESRTIECSWKFCGKWRHCSFSDSRKFLKWVLLLKLLIFPLYKPCFQPFFKTAFEVLQGFPQNFLSSQH